jgi:hypothetical protein
MTQSEFSELIRKYVNEKGASKYPDKYSNTGLEKHEAR